MNTLHLATLIPVLFLFQALTACDTDVDNNLPNVPATGRFATVGANQHSGEPEVQIAIAIFDDGEPVPLVGGDIVQASTTNNSILLLDRGFYKGSYAASLPNNTNLDQIDFLVVHDSLAAKEGRWFPVDLLNIDPGPGEFVGASASVTLPPAPLNLAPDNNLFIDINETVSITWATEAAGDTMRVRSAISCTNGTKTFTYGTVATLADTSDDGIETIGMDQFIYDINDANSGINFISGEIRAMLQELFERLSNGATDDSFFASLEPINPINNDCDIRLFLFRERLGSFDSASTNGRIFASRSTETLITYRPN